MLEYNFGDVAKCHQDSLMVTALGYRYCVNCNHVCRDTCTPVNVNLPTYNYFHVQQCAYVNVSCYCIPFCRDSCNRIKWKLSAYAYIFNVLLIKLET